jgi:hypothetical protein
MENFKMEYKTRQELNELSLKAFGVSSRWKKIMEYGVPELYERDREVVVPNIAMGKLEKKVFTDQKVVTKYYTAEEVKTYMMKIIEDRSTREKLKLEAALSENENTISVDNPNFPDGMPVTGPGIPDGTTVGTPGV